MILERFKVPEKDQVLVSEDALRRTVAQIFEKLGVSKDDAAEAADVLTTTDLRGVETHGVSNMLRAYVRDYKAGKLDPRPGWRVLRESPGTAVIDAERRLGIITDPERFKDTMDEMLRTLRTATPAPGQERVLYPGLSEAEELQHRRAHGIPLHKEVIQWFEKITGELGVPPLPTL